MNTSAIFHRAVDNFCYALNKNDIVINIKTDYDIKEVILCHGDPFGAGIMGGNDRFKYRKSPFTECKRLKNHLFWSITVTPEFKRLAYFFILTDFDGNILYLLEYNFYTPDEFKSYSGRYQYFYFPWINPADIFETPNWVNHTIWYQIFIDRFCNGNPELNPKDVKPWGNAKKQVRYMDYYGGDLPGITSKLDYLAELGITGLYLTPVCKGRSNHKYDTASYSRIDPHFGTDKDMITLVSSAHKHGIKVMMDGVFNHSGALFKPWQDVIKYGPESRYYDWFMINKWPFQSGTPFNSNAKAGNYYTFGFFDNMPKLNTNSPEVIKYILKICKSWITKYDIDGLRLDVAGEISHTLCKALRRELKALKPDFYILGELWHDSTPWLRGDEYDSVMNYPFQDGINDFWMDTRKTSVDFEYAINHCYSLYMKQVNDVLFNLLDSHDTIRLVTKLKSIPQFYQQLVILFTMPGTVCIYYGTEIAMEGGRDPDCRRCMPWTDIENGAYADRISTMKSLINIRKSLPAARSDKYSFNIIENEPRILSYTKYDDNGNSLNIILNCSDNDYPFEASGKKIIFAKYYKNNIIKSNGFLIY